jgi:hypothetical protein
MVGGQVYVKMHGTKNKLITMMWEVQVEKAFLLPSALQFLRECKMKMWEIRRITKLTRHMAPLLNTISRLMT